MPEALIISDPKIMMGKPTVAGTRITCVHFSSWSSLLLILNYVPCLHACRAVTAIGGDNA